jgi:hypothetical protein
LKDRHKVVPVAILEHMTENLDSGHMSSKGSDLIGAFFISARRHFGIYGLHDDIVFSSFSAVILFSFHGYLWIYLLKK